jgi:hypothetical protein
MMLMSSYHKAPEMWLKLQLKISSDCIPTCVIDNLKEMGRREYCKCEILYSHLGYVTNLKKENTGEHQKFIWRILRESICTILGLIAKSSTQPRHLKPWVCVLLRTAPGWGEGGKHCLVT